MAIYNKITKYEIYKNWIIDNLNNGEFHSLSPKVENFCDKFNLKKMWSGLYIYNNTFTKTLKQMVKEEILEYAFKNKVDRGYGCKGGNLISYKLVYKNKKMDLDEFLEDKLGTELECEDCGTILSLLDNECGECGEETGYCVDGYYNTIREDWLHYEETGELPEDE